MGLDTTVQEADLMFNATDSVKELGSSGTMNELHQRVRSAHQTATSHYDNLFVALETVISNA